MATEEQNKKQENATPQVVFNKPELAPTPVMGEMVPIPEAHNYGELIGQISKVQDALNYTPPTKEQLDKERKKYKRRQMVAGVSDALRAMANMYATTEYAPSAKEVPAMSAATKARYDAMVADRDKRGKEWLNYAININSLKAQDANDKIKRAEGINANTRAVYQAQVDAKKDFDKNAIDLARMESDVQYKNAVLALKGQDIKNREKYGWYANSGGKKDYYGTFNGKDYKTKADYDAAVRTEAKRLGIDTEYEDGWNKTKRFYPTDILIGEIEQKLREEDRSYE